MADARKMKIFPQMNSAICGKNIKMQQIQFEVMKREDL